tara:strand:- start:97926 stop:106268 length:8343 start_codon:yes stop_codon:yes gene_type:complete
MAEGEVSVLTYTITNSTTNAATGLAFTHTLPAALELAAGETSTNCGPAVLSAPAGSGTIELSGGTIGSEASCTVSVTVTSATAGSYQNATGDLTSSLGNSGSASTNQLTVNASSGAPVLSQAFSPSSVTLGAKSTLTFSIDNTANTNGLATISFSDSLPAGIEIDPSVAATNTCGNPNFGATFTVDTAAQSFSLFANGFNPSFPALAAGASCEIILPIVTPALGRFTNQSGGVSYDSTTTGNSVATLNVTGAPAGSPLLTKSFTNDPVDPGASVSVVYNIRNTARSSAATALTFSDDLDAALSGLTFDALTSNGCGGSVSGVGTGILTLSGGSLSAGDSCTIQATLAVPAGAAGGSFVSQTSIVSANVDGAPVTGNAASDTLLVRTAPAPTGTVSFSDSVAGGHTMMTLEITNQSSTETATDVAYSTVFSEFPVTTLNGAPTDGDCGAGSSFVFSPATAASGGQPASLSMSGGTLSAGASCTLIWDLAVSSSAAGGTYSNTSAPLSASIGGGSVTGGRVSGSMVVGGNLKLSISKVFSSSAVAGGSTTLTFSIRNGAESPVAATDIGFVDDLDGMLVGATVDLGAAVNGCGGSLAGTNANKELTFSAGALAPGASCTIQVGVDIPANAADGSYTNTTSALSATPDGGAPTSFGPAIADLQVASLSVSGTFVPDRIVAGQTTNLRYVFTNPGSQNATDLSFFFETNPIGTGTVLSPTPVIDTCGGSFSRPSSTLGFYSSGTVTAGSSCTLEVAVTSPASASQDRKTVTTNTITSQVGGNAATTPPVQASLTIDNSQLLFSKAFAANSAIDGSAVDLTFTLENTNTSSAVSSIAFVDNMDDDFIRGATVLSVGTNTCGGTVGGVGTGALNLTGGSLAAASSCNISASIQLPAGAALGEHTNTTSRLTGDISGLTVSGDSAVAKLTILRSDAPTLAKSFVPDIASASGTTIARYTITNPAGGAALANLQFSDPIGTDIPGATLTIASASGVCGGAARLSGTSTLAMTGGSLDVGTSCNFDVTVNLPLVAANSFTSNTSDLSDNGIKVADGGSATLTITSPVPTFAQATSPTSIAQGDTSTLTYSVDNTASADALTGLSFTGALPAGLRVAATPAAASACGGTLTAVAGDSSIAFLGGTLAAGATCTVQVDVTSRTVGTAGIAAVTLSSSAGGATATSTSLTVTAASPPSFAKAFAPAAIVQGATSTVTLTIDNSSAGIEATALDVIDNLPAGMTIAATPAATNTCTGGTLTAAAGGNTVGLSGASIGAGESCVVSFDVTSETPGLSTNTTGDLTSSLGNSGTASAGLTINAAPPPAFTADFAPAAIAQGATSTLTFSIDSSTALVSVTALDFTNNLPAGVVLADTPNASTTCTGGTLTAVAGSGTISYSGGSVAAAGSCAIVADVTSVTVGPALNTSGDLTSSQGNSGTASSTLTVTAAPEPDFAMTVLPDTIVQGGVTTVRFTVDNSGSLVDAETLAFDFVLPSGVNLAPTLNFSSDCSGGAATPIAGGARLTATTLAAGASCFAQFDVTATDVGATVFITGDLITSLGNSGTAMATLTVQGADVPAFTTSFTPDSIVQGAVSTLSFSIDNSAALVAAENAAFANALPSGVTIAATPNFVGSCTGTSTVGTTTFAAGGSSFELAGAEVGAGAICSYAVDVTSVTVGAQPNTTGDLTSSLGNSGTTAAILTVTSAAVPEFTSAYVPDTVEQGGVSTLTYSIDNSAGLIDVTGLGFNERFPAGVLVAGTPNAATDCGPGGVTAIAGATGVAFSGGTVAAGAICTVEIDVTSAGVGGFTGTSSVLASSQGDSAAGASATLTVTGATPPSFAAAYVPDSIAQGDVSTLTFTISNTVALVEANALSFAQTLPAGVTIADSPNAATTCNGTVTAAAGDSAFSFASGLVAVGAECRVSVDVTSATIGTVSAASDSLTSSLGDSGTATAELTVTGATPPSFAKAFAPDTIVQGTVSTLTFTVDNAAALVTAESLAFVDTMPSNMVVATSPNATTTCGSGTVTAAANTGTISLAGGDVAAAGTCTVSVDVTLLTVGVSNNVSGDLTSSLGTSGPATASLTATPADAPGFAKSFGPSAITQGETSTLQFDIDNSSVGVAATGLAFGDTFPSGMTVAAVPNATNSCSGGAVIAAAGATTMNYAGGSVGAGARCSVTVDVTSVTVGSFANTSGDLTSSLGNSGAATATLTVSAPAAPGFTSSYSPATIGQRGTTTLVLRIDNSGASIAVTGLGFAVTLPAGLTIDGTPVSTCGGSVSASGDNVTLTGGTAAAGATCTVSVDVTATAIGSYGPATGALSSSLGTSTVSGGSAPTLEVVVRQPAQVTFVQTASEDGTYQFSSAEPNLNFAISTSGGTGTFGPIDVDDGTYMVTQTRPAGVGNSTVSCNDSDSLADAATGTLTLVLAEAESVTCTYSSISTAQKTSEVINSFLNRRNNLILSNGPTRARRMARLSQGIGSSETLSFQNGDIKSFLPANINLLSAGSGNYQISTSLYQVERAALMFQLAHDGIAGSTATFEPRRFDIWFEAHYNEFKASQGSSGHFGIAYLGADYLVTPDLLAGAMLQFDSLDDSSPITNSSISGRGWMVGPYVTARLAPNLIFDGRLAYGKSVNEVSPFNTYTDTFDTDRFLIDASLSGNFDWDDWVVSPVVSISYIEERQHGYVDTLNVAIPEQTVSLGQIKFGPTFSTRFDGANHMVIEPSFTLNGIYNFGNRNGPLITNNTADETDGLRARIEAAVRITNRYGTKLEMGANYDGIGKSDYESWGANFKLSIPLQ